VGGRVVRRNAGPHNYRWLAEMTPSGSYSGSGTGVTARMVKAIQWGAEFPSQGVRATLSAFNNPAGAGGGLTIESPYFATIVVPLLSYTGATVRVEIDALVLDVPPPCTGSSWSFSELRVYVDDDLAVTAGPRSGADSYSHRENWIGFEVEDSPSSIRPCGPGCPGPTPPATLSQASHIRGGYQVDDGSGFASEVVAMKGDGPLPPGAVSCRAGGCDCTHGLPGITGADSYEVEASAASYFYADDTVTVEDCYCPTDPPGFAGTIHLHDSFARRWRQFAVVHIVPASHGIPFTAVRRDTCCGCSCLVLPEDCDFDETDDVEALTYCETFRYVEAWAGHSYCAFDWIPCPDPPGGNCGAAFEDDLCYYRASVDVYWPEEPPCGGGEAAGPHNSRDRLGRYTRTAIRDGQVWLLRADSGSPREGWDLETLWGADVLAARTMWTPNLTLRLIYESAATGHVYLTRSTDDGRTFEDPELLFMSARYPEVMQDGLGWEAYAVFKHDAGSSGPGKIYLRLQRPDESVPGAEFPVRDAGGSPIAFAPDSFAIEAPAGGPRRWVLTAMADGASEPGEWESTDEGDSWAAI